MMTGSARPVHLINILGLAVVLGLGAWLRLADLGGPSLWVDEPLHMLAAQEILRGNEPRLPNGALYDRALPYTWLTAKSFALFGESEATARLPSALIGVLLVVVTFLIGRSWLGKGAALLAALLVATAPPLVSTARLCRMYSLFQLSFLLSVYAYVRGWEGGLPQRGRDLPWAIAAPLLVLFAWEMHRLTFHIGLGLMAYWLGMVLAFPRSRHPLYLFGSIAGIFLADRAGVIDVMASWMEAHEVPAFSAPNRDRPGYYLTLWGGPYPWLWWLSLPAALYTWKRFGRRGFLLLCTFAVPFLLHSLVLERREARYVSHLFPILALLVAPLPAALLGAGLRRVRDLWTRPASMPFLQRALLTAAAAQIALIVLAAGLGRAIYASAELQDRDLFARFRPAFAQLAPAIQDGDLFISTFPNTTAYYLRRQGFRIVPTESSWAPPPPEPMNARSKEAPQALPKTPSPSEREARTGANSQRTRQVLWHPSWSWETLRPEALVETMTRADRGWVVVDARLLPRSVLISEEISTFLHRRLERYPIDPALQVAVFRWERETEEIGR